MGSLRERAGALEQYLESQVEERMLLEVESMLDVLEAKLAREEFLKVARALMERGDGDGA